MKKFRKACGRISFPHEGKESFTIYNVKNVQSCYPEAYYDRYIKI